MPLTLGRFGVSPRIRIVRVFAMSSVLEHLDRFRKGVIRSAIGVGVGILVAFTYINAIVEFVFRPIRSVLPPGSKMIYTVPGEAFSVYVTIALIAGVVLMSPFIMYQVWQLIAPALYVKQKRFAIWFILMTTAGFIGGAAFNHYVAFKMLMVFFASFNTTQLAFLPRLEDVFEHVHEDAVRPGRRVSDADAGVFSGQDGPGHGALPGVPVQVRRSSSSSSSPRS